MRRTAARTKLGLVRPLDEQTVPLLDQPGVNPVALVQVFRAVGRRSTVSGSHRDLFDLRLLNPSQPHYRVHPWWDRLVTDTGQDSPRVCLKFARARAVARRR